MANHYNREALMSQIRQVNLCWVAWLAIWIASYPAPGQILLYPGGISETEILLAYGGVHFASKMGQLAGNHFITLTSRLERLPELGKTVLYKGAQKVRFEAA